jgi:hypothetical protein
MLFRDRMPRTESDFLCHKTVAGLAKGWRES